MDMVKVHTEALTGDALNWAVMKTEGVVLAPVFKDGVFQSWMTADDHMPWPKGLDDFGADWNLMKRLVLKHEIGFGKVMGNRWAASPLRRNEPTNWSYDDDPGIAVCRAAVTEALGPLVEVPAFLVDKPAPGLRGV
ncbi:hypothetical protein V0M98_34725 (plasmid) [Pseudomonas silesiensis]|uniref:hypothetical protein n=1 Tax=Pseudomonas silesiensis TaxID=1853130 RepID=UPI0030CEC43D